MYMIVVTGIKHLRPSRPKGANKSNLRIILNKYCTNDNVLTSIVQNNYYILYMMLYLPLYKNNDELNSTYIIQSVTGLSLNNNIIVTKDNNFIIEVDEMNDKSILNFNDKNECWEFLRVFKLNVEINSYSDIVVIECVD